MPAESCPIRTPLRYRVSSGTRSLLPLMGVNGALGMVLLGVEDVGVIGVLDAKTRKRENAKTRKSEKANLRE